MMIMKTNEDFINEIAKNCDLNCFKNCCNEFKDILLVNNYPMFFGIFHGKFIIGDN